MQIGRMPKHRSLAGRIFQLTTTDVQRILTTSNLVGSPWLTDPYNSTLPFVTFQITQELARLLGMRLPHENF
ncbi:hypothetical protein XA68_11108 [Ophiocordyceps unilateralis]|uniref:Uncharacterized protein n=1 Tax=Ophiocordyceps unilateralis TaxID=268505 RepID=A0A2A9P2B3_OPHUN|nr:hypothetical protein XA68_11108 [Ophiocordyceps unilateralis]